MKRGNRSPVRRIWKGLPNLTNKDDLSYLGLLFVGGGIAGWIYEMLFYRINDGMFIQRGQGLGPWLPIYGFGSVFICLLGIRVSDSKWKVFLLSAAVSSVLELVTGWVLYHLFGGLRWWDYNTEIWNWGNIGGYICLRSILLFSFAGLFLIYIALPLIGLLQDRVSDRVFHILGMVPAGLFLLDILGGYILRIW